MRFQLFAVEIYRSTGRVRGHIVAPFEEQAAQIVCDHADALGPKQDGFSLQRIDDTLSDDLRIGLDGLLENSPAGFASYCTLGWVAHTAPVQKLRFYRSKDPKGFDIYAVAPNFDVASAVFGSTLLPSKGKLHTFSITEGVETLSADELLNLPTLLELGPIGIAEFDDDTQRWLVW